MTEPLQVAITIVPDELNMVGTPFQLVDGTKYPLIPTFKPPPSGKRSVMFMPPPPVAPVKGLNPPAENKNIPDITDAFDKQYAVQCPNGEPKSLVDDFVALKPDKGTFFGDLCLAFKKGLRLTQVVRAVADNGTEDTAPTSVQYAMDSKTNTPLLTSILLSRGMRRYKGIVYVFTCWAFVPQTPDFNVQQALSGDARFVLVKTPAATLKRLRRALPLLKQLPALFEPAATAVAPAVTAVAVGESRKRKPDAPAVSDSAVAMETTTPANLQPPPVATAPPKSPLLKPISQIGAAASAAIASPLKKTPERRPQLTLVPVPVAASAAAATASPAKKPRVDATDDKKHDAAAGDVYARVADHSRYIRDETAKAHASMLSLHSKVDAVLEEVRTRTTAPLASGTASAAATGQFNAQLLLTLLADMQKEQKALAQTMSDSVERQRQLEATVRTLAESAKTTSDAAAKLTTMAHGTFMPDPSKRRSRAAEAGHNGQLFVPATAKVVVTPAEPAPATAASSASASGSAAVTTPMSG